MRRMINSSHIEGYVYEHRLERRITGENSKNPGTEYIRGRVDVATDDALTNIVSVFFTYVTETTPKGKQNLSYPVLANILDGKICSVMEHGADKAGKVRIDSSVALNEWYDTKTPGSPLVSTRRNEGGFIHTTQELCEEKNRATFSTDMVITEFRRLEENPERDLPERGIIKGYIFDFRGAILPIEYTVYNSRALDYFEDQSISHKAPLFTRIQGQQISRTIVKKIEEPSAFGDVIIKESRSSQRDFVANWALPEPYDWDSESTILASELVDAMANREVYLADLKSRQDNRESSPAPVYNF